MGMIADFGNDGNHKMLVFRPKIHKIAYYSVAMSFDTPLEMWVLLTKNIIGLSFISKALFQRF